MKVLLVFYIRDNLILQSRLYEQSGQIRKCVASFKPNHLVKWVGLSPASYRLFEHSVPKPQAQLVQAQPIRFGLCIQVGPQLHKLDNISTAWGLPVGKRFPRVMILQYILPGKQRL